MKWLSVQWKAWLLVVPSLVFFTAFVAYPVLYSAYYSLTNFIGFGSAKYVGFANYRTLFHDRLFWTSLENTAIILTVSLVILVPISFMLAVLMQKRFKGAAALRALIFAPGIIAPILTGLLWVLILDPKIGLINRTLSGAGSHWAPQWIGGARLAPYSIALVFIWSTVGFAMTIFYAGLQMLPADVMEASALDGASGARKAWYVTIPMMRETFAITTILLITNVFKIFELVYQLTGGGPVHKSEVLVSYMYFVTFSSQQYGLGMAFAVVITALGAAATLGYLGLLRVRAMA